MKLWKLVSALGGETSRAIDIASTKKDWEGFGRWFRIFPQLVNAQDRDKLDHELPNDFVRENLKQARVLFFVSKDSVVRSRRMCAEDKEISAVEAFDRYGGDAVEEALEKGSFKP